MNIGDIVILKGKTGHGKNRVKENGSEWLILNIVDGKNHPLLNKLGSPPFAFLNSTSTNDCRWVSLKVDKDFTLTKKTS